MKHYKKRIKKAKNDFVTVMNGATFTNNKSYVSFLKRTLDEYSEYIFELGYEKGCAETEKSIKEIK